MLLKTTLEETWGNPLWLAKRALLTLNAAGLGGDEDAERVLHEGIGGTRAVLETLITVLSRGEP